MEDKQTSDNLVQKYDELYQNEAVDSSREVISVEPVTLQGWPFAGDRLWSGRRVGGVGPEV